jgi:hypothetical protein
VAAEKFRVAGGFDEDLPVAYNDVALCFRLVECGYYNVIRNDVALVHHESVARGLDAASEEKEARRRREMAKLYEKHPKFAGGYDPCYNPNLTSDKGDFSFNMNLAVKPDVPKKQKAADYTKTERAIVFSVENTNQIADTYCISGWAYVREKRNNNRNHIRILLAQTDGTKDSGFVYLADTRKIYRGDVTSPQGARRGYALVGFEARVKLDALVPGSYQVGISIDKMWTATEHQIKIKKKGGSENAGRIQ